MEDIRVDFTPEELAETKRFAVSMVNIGKKGNSKLPRDVAIHKEQYGKLGEVAFGRVFGRNVNFTVTEEGDKYDFLLGNGKTVDVKTVLVRSNMTFNFLLSLEGELPKFDYYVLALIDKKLSYGLIVGMAGKEAFFVNPEKKLEWERTPFVLPRSNLSRTYPESFWSISES